MYQKFKYIIIGTIILVIVVTVITMDAGSRYNSINNHKNEQDVQPIQAQDYNSMVQPQQNAQMYLTPEKQAMLNKSAAPDLTKEQEEEISRADFEAKKASLKRRRRPVYDEVPPNEENEQIQESNEEKTEQDILDDKGVLTDKDGIKLDDYTLHRFFKAGNDVYAIVTSDKVYSGSNYISKKFYIYKNIDNDLYRSFYLFDASEPATQDKKTQNIIVNVSTNNIEIHYTGKTKFTRKINPVTLKNSYKQFSSIPVLKYVTDDKQNKPDESEQNS